MANIRIDEHVTATPDGDEWLLIQDPTTLGYNKASASSITGSTAYTKAQSDAALALKANQATTYTKIEVDASLAGKAETIHVHTIADTTGLQAALDDKQATLVSGTNIKTINGTSVLGSGDITIAGGTGGGAVDSVNAQTGVVVLDADDISDAATTNKFVTAADKTKLSNLSGTNTGDQDLSGYSTTSHTHTLDNLSDVAITSPSTGQVLKYNGSGWVNDTDATSGGAGATNLTTTLSSTQTVIVSDTGTDAIIPAVDGTNAGVMTPTQKTKLDGIAASATANDTDANLKARANHTGTQSADTITDGTTNKAYTAAEKTKLAGIAPGATANTGDVTLSGTQTLTNKTLTTPTLTNPVFNDGSNNTSLAITVPGMAQTDITTSNVLTLRSSTGTNETLRIASNDDRSKYIAVKLNGATTGTSTNLIASQTANRDITLPDATGTVALTSSSITGSAATLTTPRAIYGNNFNGSAALTQVIASTYGGTGNGFTKFTGPATSEKTFTLPNANATILTSNAAVTVAQGGTGATTLTGILKGNGTSAVTAVTAPSGTIVGTTDTQTLSAKTLDKPLLLGSASIPATPATGVGMVYGAGTTTVRPKYMNSSGTVEAIVTDSSTDTLTNKTLTQSAWTPVTFQNSWVNFGGTAQTCAYMKDSMGFVHLKGLMKSGTLGSAAFTLPAGYRPLAYSRFVSFSNGAAAPVDLPSTGEFIPYPGSNISYSLDGITFRAEN